LADDVAGPKQTMCDAANKDLQELLFTPRDKLEAIFPVKKYFIDKKKT
jgi:hypothetical protein